MRKNFENKTIVVPIYKFVGVYCLVQRPSATSLLTNYYFFKINNLIYINNILIN